MMEESLRLLRWPFLTGILQLWQEGIIDVWCDARTVLQSPVLQSPAGCRCVRLGRRLSEAPRIKSTLFCIDALI